MSLTNDAIFAFGQMCEQLVADFGKFLTHSHGEASVFSQMSAEQGKALWMTLAKLGVVSSIDTDLGWSTLSALQPNQVTMPSPFNLPNAAARASSAVRDGLPIFRSNEAGKTLFSFLSTV